MTTCLRKIRAIGVLGVIGGSVGAVLGVIWVVASWLLGYSWLNTATLLWGVALCGG